MHGACIAWGNQSHPKVIREVLMLMSTFTADVLYSNPNAGYYRNFKLHRPDRVEQFLNAPTVSRYGVCIIRSRKIIILFDSA